MLVVVPETGKWRNASRLTASPKCDAWADAAEHIREAIAYQRAAQLLH
nr:3'-5'-bisphosphate nucleotidase [Cutibacterium acnes]